MPEPRHNKGKSKQDYRTPPVFLDAVRERWGITQFACDLAATAENTVVPGCYYDQEMNSLVQSWVMGGINWLNPPFADIEPWVQKALHESQDGAHTLVLVPAGVGSNWWRIFVHEEAHVYFLNGRITFLGAADPYPKDLALLEYGPNILPGYTIWRWQKPKPRKKRRRRDPKAVA